MRHTPVSYTHLDVYKRQALVAATKLIEMAGSKGIYHKNNVARKISRLTKLVNTVA